MSMCGAGHEKRSIPCQDASLMIRPSSRTAFLVVADGAGSALYSELGSQSAVAAVADLLRERLASWQPSGEIEWRCLLEDCFTAARASLETLVDSAHTLRSLSTTLLVLGMDDKCAASASIGDCASIVYRRPDELVLMASPDSGEYINETNFLTQSSWHNDVHFNFLEGRVAFGVAFSDSLQFVALHRGQPFSGFVTNFVKQVCNLDPSKREAAISQYFTDFVAGKRTDDDISFVAAWHSRRRF